jgi:hypothetical protein
MLALDLVEQFRGIFVTPLVEHPLGGRVERVDVPRTYCVSGRSAPGRKWNWCRSRQAPQQLRQGARRRAVGNVSMAWRLLS